MPEKNTEATERTDSAENADAKGAQTSAEPRDDIVTTRHTLSLGDRELVYTATTGRIVLREEVYEDGTFDGHKAKAEMFADRLRRSTTPTPTHAAGDVRVQRRSRHVERRGCTSGLLGPRRVVIGRRRRRWRRRRTGCDNAESLLARQRPGLHRPGLDRLLPRGRGRASPRSSTATSGDIESVAELIRLWTSRNEPLDVAEVPVPASPTARCAPPRWPSTCRRGTAMYLNGLMLISSVLDLGSIDFERSATTGRTRCYLPTYAAIAHYHGKHGDRSLREVLAEAEDVRRRATTRGRWRAATGSPPRSAPSAVAPAGAR